MQGHCGLGRARCRVFVCSTREWNTVVIEPGTSSSPSPAGGAAWSSTAAAAASRGDAIAVMHAARPRGQRARARPGPNTMTADLKRGGRSTGSRSRSDGTARPRSRFRRSTRTAWGITAARRERAAYRWLRQRRQQAHPPRRSSMSHRSLNAQQPSMLPVRPWSSGCSLPVWSWSIWRKGGSAERPCAPSAGSADGSFASSRSRSGERNGASASGTASGRSR